MSAPIPRFKPYYLTPQKDGEYVRYTDYVALEADCEDKASIARIAIANFEAAEKRCESLEAQIRSLTQPINNEELRAHFWESEFTNVYHTSVEHVDAIFTERRISALAATEPKEKK